MRWLRRVLVMACGVLLVGGLAQVPALAAAPSAQSAAAAADPSAGTGSAAHSASPGGTTAVPGPARLSDPAKVLPSGWQRSPDEAVTVSGDATGLHVLAATEASGYAWRTVATLGDPAVETDLWIGQACVTASGRYAVVVYAPEQADNMAEQQGVLGRAAIVNLRTGTVKELGGGFSIAYFDPGCGTGSTAVLTQGGWANDDTDAPMYTSLVVADAATGAVSAPVKVAGQVTSAVPYDGQIAAAGGQGVEEISASGKARLLAATGAVPFRLTPDADGSLGYQVMAGKKVGLWRIAGGQARQVASAAAGSVELSQIGGRTWLVGPQASKVAGLPGAWQPVDAPAVAQPSTTGTLAVTSAAAATPVKGQHYDPAAAQPAAVSTQLLAGERGTASFKVATAAAQAAAPAGTTAKVVTTAFAGPAAVSGTDSGAPVTQTAGSPSTPVSADRTCAIPVNDPSIQAYQPDFQQVEWAADQAVQGSLTDSRPANVYGNSLPSSYTPQGSNGLFPLPAVKGTGGSLPAQVLLGVLTQESNLQQASQHVIQGQTSNPLTSFNWYGNWTNGETDNTGLINWSNSDCGYGIGQITSGMCLAPGQNGADQCSNQGTSANPGLTSEQQLAVAVDYQANIAAAAADLINEWNNLYSLGISPTDEPVGPIDTTATDYIGMWYMAIWAYNSGIEPGTAKYGNTTGCAPGPNCTDNGGSGGNWGLGYADNPINPAYPPDRPVFPSASSTTTPDGGTYSVTWDTSHPQYWPYQEKVIAWAFDSITLWDYNQGEYVQAFAYAHGNDVGPAFDTFCVPGDDSSTPPGDNCDPSGVDTSSATAPDSCQLTGAVVDHCWWHNPVAVDPTDATHGETPSCLAADDCGLGQITYPAGTAEPANPTIAAQYAQTCDSTLPSNAVIVGEGGRSALGCPDQNWTSQGSFTWNFAPDVNGNYSSKMAFDQIGAGFGGHFWFGYSQPTDDPSDTVITGTWNPPSSVSGWTDIKVAIPSYGANAGGVIYQVDPGTGQPGKNVQVDQGATSGANTWVDLGDFDVGSGATVSLSNVTPGYLGLTTTSQDVAWSAAAFIPISGPSWDYTAMGDSYSSGEGNTPYDEPNNDCDRSYLAFGRQFAVNTDDIGNEGIQHIACSGATIANLTTTGQNGEEPQIDQIYSDTKLVTVTIGGNDIGFAGVLTNCLTNPISSCEESYNQNNSANLYTVIDKLEPQLVAAYQAIQAAAPDAKVVAVTYPMLFQPGQACLGMPVPDTTFLNNVGLYLDNTIIDAAKAAGINVLDERYAFVDGHLLCSGSDDPWIFAPPVWQAGDTVTDISSWFHPNAAGQAQIASDLGKYWTAMQSGTAPAVWPVSTPAPATGWLPQNLPSGIPTTTQAETMLGQLPQITSYSPNGYSASDFPYPITRNGCDTRNMVLRAQALTAGPVALAPPTGSSSLCPVTAGSWELPYDEGANPATPVVYSGNSTDAPTIGSSVPIDHIVARLMAYQSGAVLWEDDYPDDITMNGTATTMGEQMETDFANDLSSPEMLAVSTTTNSSKGAKGPQDWMPPNTGMYCTYVKMWIAVKWDWNLAVNNTTPGTASTSNPDALPEFQYLQDILNTC